MIAEVNVLLAFLAGLLIGSFLNVCIFRLPRDLSVVSPPRSYCPYCEKIIAWYDNIPLLSYILLRGRCRHCRERIPIRYVLVELATGLAFAAWVVAAGTTPLAAKNCLFSAIVIALIATDFEERILPDEFTLGGTLVGLVLAFYVPVESLVMPLFLPPALGVRWISLAEAAFAALLFSGLLWVLRWGYEKVRHREGLGLGDIKMMAMVGAMLGVRGVMYTLLFGSLLGGVIGLAYIVFTKKSATYELPMGSFLGIAALGVALLIFMFPAV